MRKLSCFQPHAVILKEHSFSYATEKRHSVGRKEPILTYDSPSIISLTLREWVTCGNERYLTTYHERDGETGLDYRGARFYDSDLGRFLSVDPMATNYTSWSPYNYVLGNPISILDPTGAMAIYVDGEKQKVMKLNYGKEKLTCI